MKPVCEVLSKQGLYVHWLVSQGSNTLTAHLTPRHLFIHALNIFTMYRTAMSRPANKGIYKCVQICTHRISEKGGNRNYRKWGFDRGFFN